MNKKISARNSKTSKSIGPLAFRPSPVLLVDFDGTLVDTMKPLWKCFQQFLKKYGVRSTKAEFNKLTGPAISEIVTYLKKKYQLDPPLDVLEKEYRFLVSEAYKDLDLFPFAKNALKEFNNQGLKIAIVTSSPRGLVLNILKAHDVDKFIKAIITPRRYEPSKPDPAIYLKALRKFRISPDNAIAIEDSVNGCKSATQAGIFTILLTHNKKKPSPVQNVLPLNNWKSVQKYILQKNTAIPY